MVDPLIALYHKHDQWVEIVQSFGCNRDTAEDLVMEMYIRIKRKIDEGVDIMFSDSQVNYYYIFKTLNSMFLDLKKKEKRVSFENLEDHNFKNEEKVDFDLFYELVQDELNEVHWYDKMVYELIEGGYSIQKLSDETRIGYHSLRHTYLKVKRKIKKKLNL